MSVLGGGRKNDACDISMKNKYRDIHVDLKKLMSKVHIIESLTKDERQQLKHKKDDKIAKLKNKSENRFDSSKNWSIMIDPKDNQMRNDIMRKVYF